MPKTKITHDIALDIAVGRSRKERSWKNKEIQWSDLVDRLTSTHRTAETHAEYMKAKKARQDEVKDIGAFVGGFLANGRRKAGNVSHRSCLTLDLDYAPADMWNDFTMFFDNAAVLHSTHKHSPDKPRYRLVMPLSRPVFADEYEPIARYVAGAIGIDWFDDTTYQAERLMYWPSTSKDGEFVYEVQDGPILDPDEVLATYTDWKDSSSWPVSSRLHEVVKRSIKKQEDPLEKPGIIGAFCRTYGIEEAIEAFLGDIYEPCDIEGRYTYKAGSTSGGLVVYDGKYAYSHHGTDPISGKLCNAFDLVRVHKYGILDEEAKEGAKGNRLPSFLAMQKLAREDNDVKQRIVAEKVESAAEDFADVEYEEKEPDWIKKLNIDKQGNILNGLDNIVTILLNDIQLKDRIIFDEFDQRETAVKALPWRTVENDPHIKDADVSNLKHFLKVKYDIAATTVSLEDALKVVFEVNKINSVKDYLQGLEWDGEERINSLFIDYLGAEDCEYTRAVTRKTLVAAVARIFNPGTKFDYMLTLIGKQGIGKSTIIAKLGGKWFTDSFSFHMLGQGNKAYEQLQGAWLVEAGELTGLKKADVEAAKAFLTSKEDRYRVSYGRRISHFPRKCIFFGTTNNFVFLRDQTGNRRFWPLTVMEETPTKSIWEDLTEAEINQIWAEAVHAYKEGKEPLYLPLKLERIAETIRAGHTEIDEREGLIEDFINMLVPEDWENMDIGKRRDYMTTEEDMREEGKRYRGQVCVAEIWCELFGYRRSEMTKNNTKFIHDIMGKMDGWKRARHPRPFKFYGRQRSYVKIEAATRTTRKQHEK